MDSTRSWSCIGCLKLVTISYRDARKPDQLFPDIRICSSCHQFSKEDAEECWHCQGEEFEPIQYTTEVDPSLPATHPRLYKAVPRCPDCGKGMKGGPACQAPRNRPFVATFEPTPFPMPGGII